MNYLSHQVYLYSWYLAEHPLLILYYCFAFHFHVEKEYFWKLFWNIHLFVSAWKKICETKWIINKKNLLQSKVHQHYKVKMWTFDSLISDWNVAYGKCNNYWLLFMMTATNHSMVTFTILKAFELDLAYLDDCRLNYIIFQPRD